MSVRDVSGKIDKIHDEVMSLTDSPLYTYRIENNYLPVVGQGSLNADVMLVGEAPGRNEAKTGRPFCGAAGKILDMLLAHIALKRDDIYITNIIKDRPPKNRDPFPEEIELYAPFLDRQLALIRPKIVVTLGRFAMNYMSDRYGNALGKMTIGDAHGKTFPITLPYGEALLIPQYHPAATIYNRSLTDTLTADFTVIKEMLDSRDTA